MGERAGGRRTRLIDRDNFDAKGKATMMKVLDRYEKEKPLQKLELPMSEWDIILHRDTMTVEVTRK